MKKSYPINCVPTKKRLAEIGFDDAGKPVVRLWCKACRIEHVCSFANMQRSWRDMLAGDDTALVAFRDVLWDVVKKIDTDLRADLEDTGRVEQKEEAS